MTAAHFDRPDVAWRGGQTMPDPDEMLDAARWLISEAESVLRSGWSRQPTDAELMAFGDARRCLRQAKAAIDVARR